MRRTKVFGLTVATMIFSVAAAAAIANAFAGQTTRVSVDSNGLPASLSAVSGVISADGRYVVFQSSATDLVPGVRGTHVYRHDRTTGATALVDIARATGVAGTGPGVQPTVSGNGRYVAFASPATDLIDGDNNSAQDVFVRDMDSTAITLVSVTSLGQQANGLSSLSGLSGAREISDNGQYVVFTSLATNLAGTVSGVLHVYRKDLLPPHGVELVSVNSDEVAANTSSFTPAISGNGLFVAFNSPATNLSASTTAQVYVRDMVAGTTTLESPGAAAVGSPSTVPVLSDDGNYLAFVTAAHLDPRDADNGNPDVFLRDRTLGTTVAASPSLNTATGVPTTSPSISGDGRVVAFQSLDDMIVGGDVGGFIDVFIYDRVTQALTIVSRNDAGFQADTHSVGPSLSRDGHLVLFGSTATNLVTTPALPGVNQLYVRNLAANQAPVIQPLGPIALVEAQPLHLTGSFTDGDSTSWTATVDYGDGTGKQHLDLAPDETFVLDHPYAPGAYDLRVEVSDETATGSLVIRVNVTNVDPLVSLPASLDLAFTRTLDANGTFTDPGSGSGETYSAIVNYDDGTVPQALTLSGGSFTLQHTYANAGTYRVAVTVSDSNGGAATKTMVASVGAFSYEWLDPVGSTFVVGRNLPVRFVVRGPDGSLVADPTVQVDVIDPSGAVVAGPYVFGGQPSRAVLWNGDTYHVNVDTKDLAAGTYRLRVRFASPTLTGEFTLATTGSNSSTTSRTAR